MELNAEQQKWIKTLKKLMAEYAIRDQQAFWTKGKAK